MTFSKLIFCVTVSCALYAQAPGQPEILPEARGLELTFTGPTASIAIGGEAIVRVHIENKSNVLYRLGESQTEFAFALTLYDSTGNLVPFTKEGKFVWRHEHSVFGPNAFPPGDKIDVREDLSKLFAITTPGVYVVKGYYGLVDGFQPVNALPMRIVFESPAGIPR